MRFRIVPYLLSFLSSISLLSHPAVSMKEDLDPDASSSKPLTRRKSLEDPSINALITKSGVVAIYEDLRAKKNMTPDKELVGYILRNSGWDKLTPEEQESVVSKVTGKPLVIDLDALIAKSGVVAIYEDLRAKKNMTPDKELVGYILRNSGWDKLTPEEQESVVSKVTGKPLVIDLDALITTSDVAAIYKDLRPHNDASNEELIGYILRNSGWDKLTPEEQESVVSKVTGKPLVIDLDALIAKSGVVAIYEDLRPHNDASNEELIGYILKDFGWSKLSPEARDIVISKIIEKLIPPSPGALETPKTKTTKKEIPPFPGTLNELETKIKSLEAELKALNMKRFPMEKGKLLSLEKREATALDELMRDKKAILHEAKAQLQIKIEEKIEKNKKTFSSNIGTMNKRLKTLKQGIQEKEKNIKEISDQIIKITKKMDIIEIKRNIRTLQLERNTGEKLKAFEEKLGALTVDSDLQINVDKMIREEIEQTQLKYSLDITKNRVILSQVYKGLITIEKDQLDKYSDEIKKLKIRRDEINLQALNLNAGIEEETQKFQKAQGFLNERKEKLRGTPAKKLRVTHSTGSLMEDIRKQARPRTEEELRKLEHGRKKEGELFQMFSAAKIPSTNSRGSDKNPDDSSSTEEEENEWD